MAKMTFLGKMMAIMLATGALFDKPKKRRRERAILKRKKQQRWAAHQGIREKARRLRQLGAGVLPREQFLFGG